MFYFEVQPFDSAKVAKMLRKTANGNHEGAILNGTGRARQALKAASLDLAFSARIELFHRFIAVDVLIGLPNHVAVELHEPGSTKCKEKH